MTVEADAISVSSRTSTNEEPRSSPSPKIIDLPEQECDKGRFPARKVENGETCARTGLPFIANKKPDVVEEDREQTGEKKLKEKKQVRGKTS